MKQVTDLREKSLEWWHKLADDECSEIIRKQGFYKPGKPITHYSFSEVEEMYLKETSSSNDSLEDRKKEQIKDYLKNLIEYLDGNGLVISDDELIDEGLNECGEFEGLRNILSSDKYKTAHDDLNNHYHELAQENIRLKKALEEIAECDYLPLDKHDAKGFIAIAKMALQKAKQL